MPQEKNEHIYDTEVSMSIKSLFELTTRIDERVKSLYDSGSKIEGRFDVIIEIQNELLQRVTALESKNGTEVKKQVNDLITKVQDLEIKIQSIDIIARGHSTRWEKIADNSMKLLIAIAAAFIIWRAGWSTNLQPQLTPNISTPITAATKTP